MSNSNYQSVTVLLSQLKQGSGDAATDLWRRYFERMAVVAKKWLLDSPRRIADEEDVAVDVFYSLCDGVKNGRFDQLDDRDDLWKLLVVMTRHKALNQLRHQTAKKRGGRLVRGESVFKVDLQNIGLDVLIGDDPTPDSMAEMQEEQNRLLDLLVDDSHRRVAQHRLQGFSIEETANKIGISSRSVKRKLALVRETWITSLN